MVNSFDVARLAGVSQSTVSRALRGDSKVSERTRTLVADAAKTLGYVPNLAGRALSSGRTNRIGLLVTDLSNEFYHRLIGPVVDRVDEHQHEVVLLADNQSTSDIPNRIISLGLDGVILATTTTDSVVPYKLREKNIPFVYFNRIAPAVPADAAVIDLTDGMQDLVNAIKRNGYKRVGAILGPKNATTGTLRANIFFELLAQNEIFVPFDYRVNGDFSIPAGLEGFQELMSREVPPDVIFCANDVVAMGAINAAHVYDIKVPEDVALVGFDDLPEAKWPIFSLSTVGFDLEKLAAVAVDLLFERIENPEADFKTVELPSYYVTRKSLP